MAEPAIIRDYGGVVTAHKGFSSVSSRVDALGIGLNVGYT